MIPLPPLRNRQSAAQRLSVRFTLSADERAFVGHFPGRPILPGVVQLAWAEALARDTFALSGAVLRLEQLKFRALIEPGQDIELRLEYQPEKARIAFEYRRAGERLSSGRLGLGAPA